MYLITLHKSLQETNRGSVMWCSLCQPLKNNDGRVDNQNVIDRFFIKDTQLYH